MTNTPPPSELHRRLRHATKLPHHFLDHHPVLLPLIRSDLSIVQYGDALAALHDIYAQAEAWVLEFLAQNSGLFDYDSRRKLPALEADLGALRRSPVENHIIFAASPTIGSLIGILYTLEGSTLGGQFIARNLNELPHAALPMRFFSGYGELTWQRWQNFLQFADAACPIDEYERATAAAVSLFGTLKTHLDWASWPNQIGPAN